MKNLRILLTILLYLTAQHIMQAQQQLNKTDDDATFTIKGLVREVDTYNPVVDVNIQVNGGSYTSTSLSGEFRINVKIGDEIMISHKDFETIYYTVKSHDDLTVEVHALIEDAYVKKIKTKKLKIKTICVGNIYIGGTGKTSLSIKINELLNTNNIKSCFIKKIYKN